MPGRARLAIQIAEEQQLAPGVSIDGVRDEVISCRGRRRSFGR
jgi:hypothetical protein